jgi:hypothetical protein
MAMGNLTVLKSVWALTPSTRSVARPFSERDLPLSERMPRRAISSLSRYSWEQLEPVCTGLQLGEIAEFERPHNWKFGAGAGHLAPFENVFDGNTVPDKVVIVDRWKGADGSHSVVVETPSGLRLCGRALAWDPMRPLIEPIMSWKICGGDGAIPFKFKPREPVNRDFIDPVANDATEP